MPRQNQKRHSRLNNVANFNFSRYYRTITGGGDNGSDKAFPSDRNGGSCLGKPSFCQLYITPLWSAVTSLQPFPFDHTGGNIPRPRGFIEISPTGDSGVE
jgi:hypothetical protein